MRKSLNLLLILLIISMQLWAAEPAKPQTAALAAAAAAPTASASMTGSAAPAGFEPEIMVRPADERPFTRRWLTPIAPHETKASHELNTFESILAKLREIASDPDFRLDKKGWADETEMSEKTHCGVIANLLLQRLGIHDILDKTYSDNFKRVKYSDLFTHDILLSSNKSKLLSIFIDSPEDKKIYHHFIILRIGSPTDTRYIILQAWHKSFTLAEWFGIDPITSGATMRAIDRKETLQLFKNFNPAKRLRNSDVINFLTKIKPPFPNATCVVTSFDFPNPFIDVITHTPQLPIAEPAAAAASEASPSPATSLKKCANSNCWEDGTHTCGGCHIQKYCSPKCQRANWPMHKLLCSPAPAKPGAAAAAIDLAPTAASSVERTSAAPAGFAPSPLQGTDALLAYLHSPTIAATEIALAADEIKNKCAFSGCLNPGKQLCQGCRKIKYCSNDCQRKDWAVHQPRCTLLKKLK